MRTQITHDPIIADLNRHLHQIDADEIQAERIDEEYCNLIDGDYNPYQFDNVAEAIGNTDDNDTYAIQLNAALKHQNYELVGVLIMNLSHSYWTNRAVEQAQINIRIADQKARDDDQRASEEWQ